MKFLHRVTTQDGFVDLHNHTNRSYSYKEIEHIYLTPCSYLYEVKEYVEKFGKPVAFSITDHNNVQANIEIMGHMRKNPDKFPNITYIPGCEWTVGTSSLGSCYDANGNEQSIIEGNRLHLLSYGMNPFDPDIQYLALLRNDTPEYSVRIKLDDPKYKDRVDEDGTYPIKFGCIVYTARKWLENRGIKIDLFEFREGSKIIPTDFYGTVASVIDFVKNKYNLDEKDFEDLKAFVLTNDNLIDNSRPDIMEVMSVIEKAGGYSVLAHPGLVKPSQTLQAIARGEINDPRNKQWEDIAWDNKTYAKLKDESSKKDIEGMQKFYNYIYKELIENAKHPITGEKVHGIIGHELFHTANQKTPYLFKAILNAGDNFGLYCTAGSDSHGYCYKYVIPSRIVGSDVAKAEPNYDSLTSYYCAVDAQFVSDYVEAKKTGKKLDRIPGMTADSQIKVLKTNEGEKTYYTPSEFADVVFDAFENKRMYEKRIEERKAIEKANNPPPEQSAA